MFLDTRPRAEIRIQSRIGWARTTFGKTWGNGRAVLLGMISLFIAMEQHSSSPVVTCKERRVKLIHHDHDAGILLRARAWEIEH